MRDNQPEMVEEAEDTMRGTFPDLRHRTGDIRHRDPGGQGDHRHAAYQHAARGPRLYPGRHQSARIDHTGDRHALEAEERTAEYTDRTCIVVIETPQISAGLIVDQVAEVLGIEEENICPPPDLGMGTTASM